MPGSYPARQRSIESVIDLCLAGYIGVEQVVKAVTAVHVMLSPYNFFSHT